MAKIELNDDNQVIALGEAGEMAIEVTRLYNHPAVVEYIFNYGLKQMLNDVHAGMTKKVEADDEKRKAGKLALVEKKLASLYAGEVAQARQSNGDPVMREMRAMAEAELKTKLRALGKKVGDYDKAVWRQVIDKQVAANEKAYREAAEAKLAIKVESKVKTDDILAMLEG